jgi:plastocyanin
VSTSRVTAVRSRLIAVLLTVLVAVPGLVVGCATAAGSSREGSGSAAGFARTLDASSTVVIKNFAFGPASLTVAPGTKITVVNQDQAPHAVTASDGSFGTGTLAGGQRGEITAPSSRGSYSYGCTIHPYMTGMLIVQ